MNNMIARQLQGSSRAASRFLYSELHQSCRAMTSPASSITDTPPAGPILTFLSPSPSYSRSAVGFLNELFHLPRINTESKSGTMRTRDCLDELHFGSSSSSWDSVACACPTSGTIMHFLSVSSDKSEETKSVHHALHLIAVHGSHSSSLPPTPSSHYSEEQYHDALMECRQRLAGSISNRQIFPQSDGEPGQASTSSMEARLRGLLLYVMCNVMGRQPNPSWILEKNPSTTRPISMLLDLTPFPSNESSSLTHADKKSSHENDGHVGKLRELALPFFSGVSSLQKKLSKSSLLRPLPGLYQCSTGREESKSTTKSKATDNPGLIFRPLPAADEDLRLSPPSLVFQCESLIEAQKLVEEKLGGRTFKIGWRGHGQLGSLIVSHPSIMGLDIRICEAVGNAWQLSSGFDEAQDSLLAGSLEELQSTHVVSEGKHDGVGTSSVKGDPQNGKTDCWVEFRANVKHPTGFFKQFTNSLFQKPSRTNRVAKPPDIPYE